MTGENQRAAREMYERYRAHETSEPPWDELSPLTKEGWMLATEETVSQENVNLSTRVEELEMELEAASSGQP